MSHTATFSLLPLVQDYMVDTERPRSRALSSRFPLLKKPIIATRHFLRSVENFSNSDIRFTRDAETLFPFRVTKHQSVLIRTLGSSDLRLQYQKIQNLRVACAALDGVVIPPGKIFSLWSILGKPTRAKGYVDGMLLSNGKVVEGLGGGLCQMANLLFWMFLHTEMEVVERYHHSLDVFPDSGRVLPFGSGATILYNFVDLKIRNTSASPIQIRVQVTEKFLKGEIRTLLPPLRKFRIVEKKHCFVHYQQQWFRFNEIWREEFVRGNKMAERLIVRNFAPVRYAVDNNYLQERGYQVLSL